jgi:spore germination protein
MNFLNMNRPANLFGLLIISVLLSLTDAESVKSQSGEFLFYMVDTEDSIQSFKENIKSIDIAAPQSFTATETGVVYGSLDRRILDYASENGVKVMPLIVNRGFDRETFHNLLSDEDSQGRVIHSLVELAKKYNLYGWQFDFEHIHISDRERLTEFYRKTAEALHSEGFKLSIAVVPTNTDFDLQTNYHRFLYEFWRAAYDLKSLAEIGDFISVMTYSQHTRRTPPGPVAGIPWMRQMVDYMIDDLEISPSRISLGVPFYSNWWYADYSEDLGGHTTGRGLPYERAKGMMDRFDAEVVWLEQQQVSYAIWEQDGVFEYIFLEDARSIEPKLELINDRSLRGMSVWRLGQEDSGVWPVIENSRSGL